MPRTYAHPCSQACFQLENWKPEGGHHISRSRFKIQPWVGRARPPLNLSSSLGFPLSTWLARLCPRAKCLRCNLKNVTRSKRASLIDRLATISCARLADFVQVSNIPGPVASVVFDIGCSYVFHTACGCRGAGL